MTASTVAFAVTAQLPISQGRSIRRRHQYQRRTIGPDLILVRIWAAVGATIGHRVIQRHSRQLGGRVHARSARCDRRRPDRIQLAVRPLVRVGHWSGSSGSRPTSRGRAKSRGSTKPFGPHIRPRNLFRRCQNKLKWFGTVRGRAGIAFDRVLWYGTGGWAFGKSEFAEGALTSSNAGGLIASTAFNTSNSMDGWTVGGGIEWAFLDNWTAKFNISTSTSAVETMSPSPVGHLSLQTVTSSTTSPVPRRQLQVLNGRPLGAHRTWNCPKGHKQCPASVISGHLQCTGKCPLCAKWRLLIYVNFTCPFALILGRARDGGFSQFSVCKR